MTTDGRAVLEFLTVLLLGTSIQSAAADPMTVDGTAGVEKLASMITAYADAERVRWVVATPDAASRAVLLKTLADRVGPDLIERVRAEAGPRDAAPAAWVETAPPRTASPTAAGR